MFVKSIYARGVHIGEYIGVHILDISLAPTGALYVLVPNYTSSAGHFFFFFRF